MRIHNVFHTSKLKPYHDDGRVYQRPPPVVGQDQYVVERFLDKEVRTVHGKKVSYYLVQWAGYPIYEATWEPSSHFKAKGVLKMRHEFDKVWTPKS